jgi:hypothetical protein
MTEAAGNGRAPNNVAGGNARATLLRRWELLRRFWYLRTKTHARPAMVEMSCPRFQNRFLVALMEGDEEVRTFAAKASAGALAYGIWHGRPHRRSENSHSGVRHSLVQFLGEDAIPVVDREPMWMIARKSLPELLQSPPPVIRRNSVPSRTSDLVLRVATRYMPASEG